jgi:hypothetical protein
MAFFGLADSTSGEKKKRYAVGPKEGNTKALPVRTASNDNSAIVMNPFTNT